MTQLTIPVAFLALAALLFNAAPERSSTDTGRLTQPSAEDFTDLSPHRSGSVLVNGVRLDYLDWGGDGPPLVLIHGLGDNPHVFDDLAPLLRDRFRVVAYARRGHGSSDAPPGPYDVATLVEDLRQVLDSLGIARASLLGWSLGGNEITAFAARYPERVEKLVYLESGYDWSDPTFLVEFRATLAAIAPDASALASFDAYRTWFRTYWLGEAAWSTGLEAYLRDTVRIDADGRLRPVTNDAIATALLAMVESSPRDYASVRAPALALYSPIFFPAPSSDPAQAERARGGERRVIAPFRRASMNRIRRELRDVRVEEIAGTTHMSIGVAQPERLAATIEDFLLAPLERPAP